MKVSLEKVLKAWVAIRSIEKQKGSNKWAYGISKNKNRMQGDIDGIAASEKTLQELDNERVEICKKLAAKNESGEPVFENGKYIGIDEKAEEFVAVLDKIKKAGDAHVALLTGETEIDLYQIPFEEIPNEIAPVDFENLAIMIAEPK